MKLVYDYFPIICFFIAYKFYGIFIATAVTMAAALLQILIYWLIYRRFETMHLIMLAFILVLGSATLFFHKAIFIQWKPSIIYWTLGALLISSHIIGKKPLIYRMLSDQIDLPKKLWKRINFSWGIFLLMLGCINIYVVYHYSTNAWVNFKLFGTLGLTLLFGIIQILYLLCYMKEEKRKQ